MKYGPYYMEIKKTYVLNSKSGCLKNIYGLLKNVKHVFMLN